MTISGSILKRLRNSKNMTLKELVADVNEKLGTDISIGMVSRWENGKSEVRYKNLKCMALYHNVTTDFLLGFDLNEFSDIVDLRNDLEITQMIKESEERYIKKLEERCKIIIS